MDGLKVFSILFAVISVVYGVCDRQAVAKCLEILSKLAPEEGKAPDMQAICGAYSELQTCLSPLREACKDDVTWASVTGMETSYGPMCGGGGAGTGGAGTDGTAGCSMLTVGTCLQPMKGLENLGGFPTSAQMNTLCGTTMTFKDCIKPYKESCDKSQNETIMSLSKSINAIYSLADLFCMKHKSNFIKYAGECFDKGTYATESLKCNKPPPTDSAGKPKAETRDEECSRESANFDCYIQLTKDQCSAEVGNFAESVKSDYMKAMAPLCPTSGAIRLGVQIWIFLAVTMAAVFMY